MSEVAYIRFKGCGAYVHMKSSETVTISSIPEEDKEEALSKLKRGDN